MKIQQRDKAVTQKRPVCRARGGGAVHCLQPGRQAAGDGVGRHDSALLGSEHRNAGADHEGRPADICRFRCVLLSQSRLSFWLHPWRLCHKRGTNKESFQEGLCAAGPQKLGAVPGVVAGRQVRDQRQHGRPGAGVAGRHRHAQGRLPGEWLLSFLSRCCRGRGRPAVCAPLTDSLCCEAAT